MASRILAIHYTPPGIIGGVESVLDQHVRLLSTRGFRLEVVAGRPGSSDLRAHVIPEIDAASPENAQVERELAAGVVGPRFVQRKRVIGDKLRALAADADFVIAHNAFTLHFNLPLTAALWELAGLREPGSVIAWCHDLAWTNPLYLPAMHPGYPWDLLRVPAPNTVYVTVSEERRLELQALWEGCHAPVKVVPNGVDVAAFLRLSAPVQSIIERYRLLERDIVALLPVRITRRKNIELGIRAIQALRDAGKDVLFLISGPMAPHHPIRSQSYLSELKTLCAELGVAEQVVFLADELGENLEHRSVSELYAICDVLLFPSSQEGFGLPILEAGLSRLPAVVADIAIFREVGGQDVRRFSLEAGARRVAAEVMAAVDNGPSRLFRRVLRQYSWEVVIDNGILPLLSDGAARREADG